MNVNKEYIKEKAKARIGNSTNFSAENENSNERFRPSDKLKLMSMKEIINLNISIRRSLWGKLITSNQTGMIFGERGSGKSWVALGIAIAMATVTQFLGNASKNKRRVVYLDGEMDLVTIRTRLMQICTSFEAMPPESLRIFTPEIFTDLLPAVNTCDGQDEIDKMIGTDWDVLFVDNYSSWSSDGKETPEAWAPFMRWMLRHKRAGRTVIVIHHAGKTGKQRGSSKHEDNLDWSINLVADKTAPKDGCLRFSLVWEKARHLASNETLPIAVTMIHGEKLEWKYKAGKHTDLRHEKALELKKKEKTNAEIADELGVDRTTVGRWLGRS
jgi:putative DNA primase/helicase